MEEIIGEFIELAHNNSPDAWWIYENPEEAIKKYMEFRKSEDGE